MCHNSYRHTAVSELGSIRDRVSRHEGSPTAGWGLDWSRRINPTIRKENVPHHVSSASNSYGTVPSASTTSLLYSRPRQRPAVQRRFLQEYRPALSPYVLPSKRSGQVMQFDRFENSPSSSTSNGNNLPVFAYHLNKVATHRRRAESMIPIQTVYGIKREASPIVNRDDILFAVGNVRPNPETANVKVVEVTHDEEQEYPDIIVRSTLGLAPTVQAEASSTNDYPPLYSDSLGQKAELAQLDESVNDVEADNELSVFRNHRGEGIPYQQILLDNAIDLGKLMKENEKENMIVQQVQEEDTGKSLINLVPSQSRRVQLITDSSIRPVIEDDHKVIYLKMFQPEATPRLKGTKLKEVLESNDDQLNKNSFESFVSGDMKHSTDESEHKVGLSDPYGFDVIENQIAAVNRIGNAASSESEENTQAVNNKLMAEGPRARLNKEKSSESNITTSNILLDLVDDNDVGKKQKLKNFGDVEQRSNSPVSQNKQLADYYPQPPSDVYNQGVVLGPNVSGSGTTSTTTSTTSSRPYKQKYPGWANVKPYKYSEGDPETGAYKFGYGDQYQWRHEERREDGVVFGGYGWLDETGTQHIIRFVADRLGYRVLPQGQEIDFNQIPVYPPFKETEDTQFPVSSSQGYNKIDFVTPRPLKPSNIGGYPVVTSSSTDTIGIPDFNVPQVHPPVSYPGSILQLLDSNSVPQSRPVNTSTVNNISRPGIALTFNDNSVESSTIPTSILESLLKEQAKQPYQGRSQTDVSALSAPDEDSPTLGLPDAGNPEVLAQSASTINLLPQNNSSSELRPPLNTASNSIAVPTSSRDSIEKIDPQ
ncbi:Insect cuticle protein [Trinorchestia longiramus]|nr:Insect cuticle protein [Trinorchestia longiramus]